MYANQYVQYSQICCKGDVATFVPAFACVCVCVCACVQERKRKRVRALEMSARVSFLPFPLSLVLGLQSRTRACLSHVMRLADLKALFSNHFVFFLHWEAILPQNTVHPSVPSLR